MFLSSQAEVGISKKITPTWTGPHMIDRVVNTQQVLQQGVDEVEAAVTPGWWTTVEKIWTRIHVVGQLGGLITVGILITQICKFIWRLFKLYLWGTVGDCLHPRRHLYHHRYAAPAYEENAADPGSRSKTSTASTMA